MKNQKIVEHLLKKTNGDVPAAMDFAQPIIRKVTEMDEEGVDKFFITVHKEMALVEDEDCMLINGRVFDWKESQNPELLDELIDLAINSMSTKDSREELKKVLLEC